MEPMETTDSLEQIEGENVISLLGGQPENFSDLQAFADEVADIVEEPRDAGLGLELAGLRAKVKDLEESQKEAENKYGRLLADFQNLRNRSAKEIQSGVEQAEKQILLEVLQVLDSFGRCINSTYQNVSDFRTGVDLIEKQFLSTLRRLRVSEIEIKAGDTFDAHTAEALATVDMAGSPPGSVVDVCEKGFMIGGLLLRPAKVVVARGDAPQ
jgi:molecular chaperone GrpE